MGFLVGAILISASISSAIIELTSNMITVWHFMTPSVFFIIAVAVLTFCSYSAKVLRTISFPLVLLYIATYGTVFRFLVDALLAAPTVSQGQ